MGSYKVAVSLVLALTIVGRLEAAPAEDLKDGDVPSSDEGPEDNKGRTFGLFKKPLYFQGYDSVIETGLDSIGSLLGVPGSFGNFLTRFKPFRPNRPNRPLRPYRPIRPTHSYRPSSRPVYYEPYDVYATEYGYGPYPYYDDGFYNDFRDDRESRDENVFDADFVD